MAGLWLLYSDSAIVITVWSLTADSTDSNNTLKPKFWPTKHFLNKPDKKQRQSHWGLWPRLHEPLEVNCLTISCTWGTNASFSNNRRTKASVNAMKLGTWRAACTQMTLTKAMRVTRPQRELQALPVWGFLIIVVNISGGAMALLWTTPWFYCTLWISEPLSYKGETGGWG